MPPPRHLAWAVAAAALGYFVDLYDIVLFGVVRVASLNELGITGAANTQWGITLLNLQMLGMLIGGFFWGWIADRYGRRFALLATIALYSTANVANGFVTTVEQYALLRLLAGIGLAGELGAGVTLIAELLPKNKRGYGTTIIAFLGLIGALTASILGSKFHWRAAYMVGGAMGFVVLALRLKVLNESALFHPPTAGQGVWRTLLARPTTLRRFVAITLLGVPIWYASALFVTLAPEYGKALGFELKVGEVLRWQAIGLAIGSAAAGLLSEALHSRRKVVAACLLALAAMVWLLLHSRSPQAYLPLMFALGLAQGYWTLFITLAAEQFGSNIRGTVATAAPNLVRAATVPITLSVKALWPLFGLIGATLAVGAIVLGLAALALWRLPESWGRNLDFTE